MYTKKEREFYNQCRDKSCKRLNITVSQYNYLRRKGEALRQVYENNCNGIINDYVYDVETRIIEDEIYKYLIKQKINTPNHRIFVYFQTDPRGSTIYLDTEEISESNYNQAVCIY